MTDLVASAIQYHQGVARERRKRGEYVKAHEAEAAAARLERRVSDRRVNPEPKDFATRRHPYNRRLA